VNVTAPAAVVVLAAGEGKRMKSSRPKVLHTACGRSLLGHVLTAAAALEPVHTVVVVGHGRDQVSEQLAEIAPAAISVVQEEQLGTGHAVRIALAALPVDAAGTVIVLAGDTPLLAASTLQQLAEHHAASQAAATVLTAEFDDPTGYGRIVRAADGSLAAIVEHRDADAAQRAIREVNSGVYAFELDRLREVLAGLTANNDQGEEYLTDAIALLRAAGAPVAAAADAAPEELLGVNDRAQLAEAAARLRDRIVTGWMRSGVTVIDPSSVWIDIDVTLEPDVLIQPDVQLLGATSVAAGASIGPRCTLTDTEVGAGASVIDTVATLARIGEQATVGPFTYLRPGTDLGVGAKAGGFVEMKNAVLGPGAKVPHLSYVGDAEIGAGANIGAATVFVNYDGVAKHRTVVGEQARVGSDTMLVAPVTIGPGAYTAAGSVITEDVPPGAMAVARSRQRNIADWVLRRRPGSSSADAAARAGRTGQDSTADKSGG
jgi:bifunctional UDP-N-acetylglucosamine pyrophosphorylase / glucosamine-1-phosphate N-acetyltransferase